MNKEELVKMVEEKKEKIAKMSEEELQNASGGLTPVSPYQAGCAQYVQNVMINGEAPKQCAYCMFAVPYRGNSFLCINK